MGFIRRTLRRLRRLLPNRLKKVKRVRINPSRTLQLNLSKSAKSAFDRVTKGRKTITIKDLERLEDSKWGTEFEKWFERNYGPNDLNIQEQLAYQELEFEFWEDFGSDEDNQLASIFNEKNPNNLDIVAKRMEELS